MAYTRGRKRTRSVTRSRSRTRSIKRAKYAARRINRRAITRNNPRRSVNLGAGLPSKLTITHKYLERVTFNNAIPAAAEVKYFRANSLYDPNASAGGHQPMYFDQIGQLYDHYTVIMSRIKVSFQNTATVTPVHVIVYVDDNAATTGITWDAVAENTGAKRLTLGAINGQGGQKTITKWWGIKKWFGKVGISDEQFTGTLTTSPSEESYFAIVTQPVDGITAATVYAIVEIEYTAVWHELKDIDQS